jgi:hypothetical protein
MMASNPIAPWPMSNWFNWMNPGRPEMPLAGDVAQAFKILSGTATVNGAGDPALEREIVEDVATYGAQIGQISEIVLALAAGEDLSGLDALAKLKAMAAAIEKKKADYGKTALERARKALDDLREHDPKGYELLVATLEAKSRG